MHGASEVGEIFSAHVIHVLALERVVVDSLSENSKANTLTVLIIPRMRSFSASTDAADYLRESKSIFR